ncbi:DUF4365 domain-containing protein, partial [Sphingomonas sp. NCPPB 2930]
LDQNTEPIAGWSPLGEFVSAFPHSLGQKQTLKMVKKFPTRPSSSTTADIGINCVATIFNDIFGWIFRRTHQEHDFGVDAYVDYVSKRNAVTGRTIAAQIKTGASYLSNKGSMHWYKDTKEHLNYFLNLQMPVLLIICDPNTKICFWAALEKDKVDFQESGWRYPIPKTQILDLQNFESIELLFGEAEDHVSKFEVEQQLLGKIGGEYFIHYSIPRSAIENRDTTQLKRFMSRISNSERLAKSIQGRIYLATYGYENDSREVNEIAEIREWAHQARNDIKSWYLFARTEKWVPSTLIWIAACTCEIISSKFEISNNGRAGYQLASTTQDLVNFKKECYDGLNIDSEKWGWPIKYSYDVSKAIHLEIFPSIPYPPLILD